MDSCRAYIVGLTRISGSDVFEFGSAIGNKCCFSLVSSYMYGKAWKYFAKNSANSLGKFYMGGSMLRMVLAAIVALIGAVVYRTDHEKVLTFVLVFAIFYLAIMIFESIYFIRVEKNNK